METSDLKQQFQQLQDQQQQKLLERRRKKEQANKNKNRKENSKEDPSGKFGVNDDLDLKLADPPGKGYGYVSEELVDHLNDQIRQMKDENGRLYKLLSERDFEIRQVKKKLEESKNTALDGPVTNETAATRIIELSKKVRELTAEKESEKTRCKQFQKKCHDLQRQLQNGPPSSETSSIMGSMISLRSQTENKDDEVDVKALQDRLKQSEGRATDFRNQCQSLRQELKIANKVLSQEIGENVNIQSLLNETSSWRGRAQQIIGLQQKVDELKAQLDSQSGESGGTGRGNEKVSTARRRQEEKYREDLRRMDRERKEAQENMAKKLKTLETENEDLKGKLDAAKTRNKVLSNEMKDLKPQVQTLLKKSRNDDEFIDALMKQQGQLKQLLEEHNEKQTQQHIQQQQQLQHMSMKSQQDNNIVEQLKAIAAQKESQVKMLEMELQHLKMAHTQNNNPSYEYPMPQPIPGLVAVTATLDSRPTTASDADNLTSRTRDITQSALGSARTASRASSRATTILGGQVNGQAINQQELAELRYQCQELETMSRATEVEKDKMTELVQVLQGRLAEETQKLSDTQVDLQAQKRIVVELEKRLGKQNLEATNSKRKGTARGLSSSRDRVDEETDDDIDKNELMTRLEIQKDENEALKNALQRTLKAKEEDLKVYGNTLEETKKVFLQALRQMKDKLNSS